jgi:SAP domain
MPDYGKKTVAELQEILKGRSLPHTGKKAELVARLNEADKSGEVKTGMFSEARLGSIWLPESHPLCRVNFCCDLVANCQLMCS